MTVGEAVKQILLALFLFSGACFFTAGFLFFCELAELARSGHQP